MDLSETRAITLALQGGGAHGAFTWGVLDRLLEEPAIRIEGISGTSAGAMNAAVLASGYEEDGSSGARAALQAFWREISRRGAWSPYRSGWLNPLGAEWSPLARWFDFLTQVASPYQFNPLNLNPLRSVLEGQLDFDRLRRCRRIKLYVAATNVLTNQLRLFQSHEMSPEVLLASACLPHLNQAVEIDGEHYWDGGFLGNPVLEPLVAHCASRDIVIVQLNPTRRRSLPTTAPEIIDRVNEITFNASLMREIRNIAAVSRLVDQGEVRDPRYESTCFHMVAAEEMLEGLSLASKYDTGWGFLRGLFEQGRQRADAWLARNLDALGQRSTLDFATWTPSYVERDRPDEAPLPPWKHD